MGKEPSKLYYKKDKNNKKKINHYVYSKEGYIVRNYQNKNTVKRQLNVLYQKWKLDNNKLQNVIIQLDIIYYLDNIEVISRLDELTLTTSKDISKAKLVSEEKYKTLEEE